MNAESLGDALFIMKRYEEAADAYTIAIQKQPANGELWGKRAEIYVVTDHLYHAFNDSKKAYSLRPNLRDAANIAKAIFYMDGYPHMETAASYIENHLAKYPQKANMEKRKFPEAMSFLKEIRQIMKNKDYIADQKDEKEHYEYLKNSGYLMNLKDFNHHVGLPAISKDNRVNDSIKWSPLLKELDLRFQVVVAEVPNKGRGLFAAKDYSQGDVILEEMPLLAASVDERACYHCIKFAELRSGCKNCNVRCCSEKCMEEMKTYHSCNNYSESVERLRSSSRFMSLPLLLINKYHGLVSKKSKESESLIQRILALSLTNNKDAREFLSADTSKFEEFTSGLSKNAFVDYRWYREVLKRFNQNAIPISYKDDKYKHTLRGNGVGLYLVSSMLNHDCLPNVKISFNQSSDGGKIQLVAARDIKKNEELTIKYVNVKQAERERNIQLHCLYAFKCDCTICKMEKGLTDETYGITDCKRWTNVVGAIV